ncbi:unnamed protein product [Rotaria socialis]
MSTQAIKKLKTEKGKDMLSYEGYIYTLERKTDVKLIFRSQRRDCKGRCHTNPTMDAILSGPTEHCHAPTPDLVPVFELKSKIKARAAETEEFPSAILHSVMRSFPLDAAGQLPQGDTLLRTIRRQRPASSTNNDNQLPDNLKQTDRGENFVLHEDEKLIIFTTATNLSVLKTCKHWFVDGTFKVCPEDFYQMFTLHGLYKSQVIPLVYGLLVGNKTTDYDHFFRRIMDEDDFDPETILSDFEAATIKSINSLFPNIVHKDVIKAFDLIADDFDDDADDFLGYFEKTWIGEPKKRGTGRKKPLFTIELWNVYDRIVANLPRSNNSIEGWHNAFAKRVAIVHPSVSKLTEKIRREQSKFELDIAQIRQGQEPKPKKLKYRKLDERIKRLVDDYHNLDLGEYLKGLAVNMSL